MSIWKRLNELEAWVNGLEGQNLCQRIENLEAVEGVPLGQRLDPILEAVRLLRERVEGLEKGACIANEELAALGLGDEGLSGRMAMDASDPRTADAWTPLQELVKELAGRVAALEDKAGVKPKGRKKNG